MTTFIIIVFIVFVIAILCGADPGSAICGIFVVLVCIAQWAIPFVFLAWLISLFI